MFSSSELAPSAIQDQLSQLDDFDDDILLELSRSITHETFQQSFPDSVAQNAIHLMAQRNSRFLEHVHTVSLEDFPLLGEESDYQDQPQINSIFGIDGSFAAVRKSLPGDGSFAQLRRRYSITCHISTI